MTDLFADSEPEGPETLEQIKIGEQPVMVMLFTAEGEKVLTHSVEVQRNSEYVLCPGGDCPLCFIGSAPVELSLLPVYSIAKRVVGVLRITATRGPRSLWAQLQPHMKSEGLENKVFLIARDGMGFRVDVRPLAEGAERGVKVIKGFLKARAEELSLSVAFYPYTGDELADLPAIRRQLDAIGGWPPKKPEADQGARIE